MRKTVKIVLALSFALALALCVYYFVGGRRKISAAALPVAGRSLDISTDLASSGPAKSLGSSPSKAHINPEYGEVFLDAFDVNLDEDEDLEQIIVAKPSAEGRGGERLSVVVADFNSQADAYRRLWKGETLAVQPRAFVVQPRDLLGNGGVELLCFGIDESKRQTLTIFMRTGFNRSPFKTIFSESGLSIDVQDQQGTSPRPVLIQVFDAAPDGASPLDQTRRDFSWSALFGSYRPGPPTLIPGEKVEKAYIDRIVTGSAADFETYLEGLWVKEGKEREEPLVSFSSSRREIVHHGDQESQVWDWGESTPGSAGITAPISNGAVPDMLRLLSVELVGVDKIRIAAKARQIVRFAPREDWDGVYRRYPQTTPGAGQAGFLAAPKTSPLVRLDLDGGGHRDLEAKDFEGSYVGQGFSLELSDGIYRTLEQTGPHRGRYYFFRWGTLLVLDLAPYEEAVNPADRRTYIVDVRPGEDGGVAGLRLRRAQVTADSVQRLYEPDLELERLKVQGSK